MMRVFPRTRERERAWKLALGSVGVALVLAPILHPILYGKYPPEYVFSEICWAFSIVLESVCVLPQLLLLRQTTVPTVINSYYLVTLGSYRALYIVNWLVRGLGPDHYWDRIADVFGVIQTAFYIDFAWVYYTRQRVKLRNGGVVDSEDFRNGWLLGKVFNFRQRSSVDEEEQHLRDDDADEVSNDERPRSNRWGARGISISADDTLDEHRQPESRHGMDDENNGGTEGFVETEDGHLGDIEWTHSPTVPGNRD
ncbi:hypothetical protein EYZ11_009442 [Aspergillus tanneri]|nr:hypothetical protein EYZ11_009442 [Aspergillus tanneri]